MQIASFLHCIVLPRGLSGCYHVFPHFLTNSTTWGGERGELLKIKCFNFLYNVSATFVTPKQFSHTPSLLHISRATVYIHKSFSNQLHNWVLSLLQISSVNRSHFPETTSVANTLNSTFIHSRIALHLFQSGISNVLNSGQKSCYQIFGYCIVRSFVVSCVLQIWNDFSNIVHLWKIAVVQTFCYIRH